MLNMNLDYRRALRTGYYIDKHQLRHENEAGAIVALAVMAALLTVLLAIIFPSCSHAEVYDSSDIADAIYQAEGGSRAVKPYGVLSVPCRTEADCRAICLNTIENTFTRWQANGSKGDFLEALAARYCPIGASNDPQGLNRHWLGNVRQLLAEEGRR